MKKKTRKKRQMDGLVVCAGISFLPDMLREIDKRRGWMPRSVFVRNAIAKVLYGQKELNHSNEKKKKQKDAGALQERSTHERVPAGSYKKKDLLPAQEVQLPP
jgi:hypothetical protein